MHATVTVSLSRNLCGLWGASKRRSRAAAKGIFRRKQNILEWATFLDIMAEAIAPFLASCTSGLRGCTHPVE